MAPPPHYEDASERKSSKIVALSVLGVLSLTLVGIWAVAEANDDDDDVTADCVLYVEGDAYSSTPDPTATPSPGTSTPPPGSYQVVDDSNCDDDNGYRSYDNDGYNSYDDDDNNGGGNHYSSYRFNNYGDSRGAYRWYYGGTRQGDRVSNGSTYRPSDVNINSRSGKEIQRGGFGNRSSSGS
ncbi:hypothetical protein ABZ897_00280 [Nonomuraea sp. NPDC046802]|uniref:hypothetical protein n=1 Tax=Nonomuraea sp. NPDC046802 TaxID=3154919 RepID=UPI00340EE3DE